MFRKQGWEKVLFERKKTILGGFSVFFWWCVVFGKKKLCRERVSVGKEFILFFLTLLTLMRVCEEISVNN